MKTSVIALLLVLVLAVSGCGTTHHVAHAQPCTEAQRQEHPLACEQQSERADPELARMRLTSKALKRVEEGRTPQVAGEDNNERITRAEEEIKAEQATSK